MVEENVGKVMFGKHARCDRTGAVQAVQRGSQRTMLRLVLALRMFDRILEVDIGLDMQWSVRRRFGEVEALVLKTLGW